MTPQKIMEQSSNRFVGILAANKGFMIDKGELDNGIDFQLSKTFPYRHQGSGELRYLTDGSYPIKQRLPRKGTTQIIPRY